MYLRYERVWLLLSVSFVATVPYSTINRMTAGRPAATLQTWADESIPYSKQWIFIYAAFVLFAFLPAVVIRDNRLFRRVALSYLLVYAIGCAVFLLFPTRIVRYVDPTGESFMDWGIRLNHWLDAPTNCFPSLHVAGAMLASLGAWKADRPVGVAAIGIALLVAISTLTVKAHYLADVVVGTLLAVGSYWLFVHRYPEHPELRYPRWMPALLPVLFVLAVAWLYWLYRNGFEPPIAVWQTAESVRPWPPALRAQ